VTSFQQSGGGLFNDAEAPIDGEAEEILRVEDAGESDQDSAGVALAKASAGQSLERRREGEMAVRAVAVAAAGGVVAGAASVALIRAVTRPGGLTGQRRSGRRRDVAASHSFLIDVHLLKQGR